MEIISIKTEKQQQLIDLTARVKEIVKNSGIKDGIALVFTPHSTAGITIACGIDPNALLDVNDFIDKMVPLSTPFKHTMDPVTDAAGHLKSLFVNPDHTFPVVNGELKIGGSQEIYFFEFDGPRSREVYVQVVGK